VYVSEKGGTGGYRILFGILAFMAAKVIGVDCWGMHDNCVLAKCTLPEDGS